MTPRRLLAAFVLAPVVTLAACGGDGTTDRDAITKIITDGGRDPVTICDHLSDPLRRRFGTVAACRKAARADAKNVDPGVKVDRLDVAGDAATADVTGNDGRTRITFVKDGGSWKVADTRQRTDGGG
ncbi:MAG: hypothetical protein JWM31_3691 [Solirubrobacterales bacterium]|nr:hypothetical protein [Solirubrobacterales bacterium]